MREKNDAGDGAAAAATPHPSAITPLREESKKKEVSGGSGSRNESATSTTPSAVQQTRSQSPRHNAESESLSMRMASTSISGSDHFARSTADAGNDIKVRSGWWRDTLGDGAVEESNPRLGIEHCAVDDG